MPATPPKSGDLLGERYLLDFRTADAGLGEAWTARDRQDYDAPVVLKLLGAGAPGEIDDPRSLPAVIARLKRVEQPDVLPVRAWGDHDGRLYLVHDRYEGRGLAGWIAGHRQARTRPGLATAQRILDRVAGALDGARGAGAEAWPHGALSPRSVVLRREGPGRYDVKVMDFGLAALLVPASGEHALDAAWRAPEQSSATSEETPRTDVFALAMMLAEVLGPSQIAGPAGTLSWARLALDEPAKVRVRLGSIRTDVPHAIWDVVGRALSGDPALRPADAAEFRALLQQSWKKVGLWEKPALTPEPEPPEAPASIDGHADVPRTRFGALRKPQPAPVALPVPPPSVTVQPAPVALPVPPPQVTPSPASVAPPRKILGLGSMPLGVTAPRRPVYDDAPTMLPFTPRPAPAPRRDEPTVPAPVDRAYLAVESTSIDVHLPMDVDDDTGEGPPPIDDPSPTPPDGVPVVLTASGSTPGGFRMGSRLSAPPEEPRAASPKPAVGRQRARTLGAEESSGFAPHRPPAPQPSPDPEGTLAIGASWQGPPGHGAIVQPWMSSQALPESSGDAFASRSHDAPPTSPSAQNVDRTVSIDLSASGVDPPSPAPAPANVYVPQPPVEALPNRVWGAAPSQMPVHHPPAPVAPTSTTWWIVGGVAVAVILMMLVVLVRL